MAPLLFDAVNLCEGGRYEQREFKGQLSSSHDPRWKLPNTYSHVLHCREKVLNYIANNIF